MMKTALIRSRDLLSEKQLETVMKRLGADEIKNVIDDSVSGGFLVEIGDRLFDYSLAGAVEGRKPGEAISLGEVKQVGDGIAKVKGLSRVMAGELVSVRPKSGEDKIKGLALNLEEDEIGVVLLSEGENVRPGDAVVGSGEILSVPVGKELVGRVVNPLGETIDGNGPVNQEARNPMEKVAPGVMTREAVNVPLQTGVLAVDAMIPIGRGQRELIIGDRQTGKTALALTTIINQKGAGVTCVYVAIGQKRSSIAQIKATLERFGAMEHTIIVAATASDPAALQYLAPYAGCAIAEYFLAKGKDALVVYDDLTKHAWAYRQISLLLKRPSGREAYPGDIFYAHSRLLERACRLNKKYGGGSITALPIIETQAGDVSAYIPTNVISITDGQIYLLTDLFNSGQRPAVDVGNSVSRVGGTAQIKAVKQVAGKLRLELAQFRELQAFSQFASDLDEKTQKQLERGKRLSELLKQGWEEPMPVAEQVLVLWMAMQGGVDGISVAEVKNFEAKLLAAARTKHQGVLDKISQEKTISESLEKEMRKICQEAEN